MKLPNSPITVITLPKPNNAIDCIEKHLKNLLETAYRFVSFFYKRHMIVAHISSLYNTQKTEHFS